MQITKRIRTSWHMSLSVTDPYDANATKMNKQRSEPGFSSDWEPSDLSKSSGALRGKLLMVHTGQRKI